MFTKQTNFEHTIPGSIVNFAESLLNFASSESCNPFGPKWLPFHVLPIFEIAEPTVHHVCFVDFEIGVLDDIDGTYRFTWVRTLKL